MAAVKREPERTVLRLRFKGTFSASFVKSTWSLASRTSMVMFIVCSSVARNTKLPVLMAAPTAEEGLFVTEKPVLEVAKPVVGLKLLLPAA